MLEVHSTRIWGALACLLTALILCQARPDYTGLEGPYCATRYRQLRCCPGRQDECSVPILGTLCYCDDFCSNRTGTEDCCPDFWSFCKGEEVPVYPPPGQINVGTCNYNGKILYPGNKVKENCNYCECSSIDGNSEMLCERNRCLMDQEIIDRVNILERANWIARNYTEFHGRTLDEGLKLRLGTLNPSKFVYRMNPVKRFYDPNDLPKEFDSRTRWPGDITPVHDQSWCGASWAISTVDVASDRFGIMSKGVEKVQLSAQHLLSCNNKGQQGCNGGYLDRAWLFMRRFGTVDEDCYRWTGKEDKCRVPRKGKLTDAGCKSRSSITLKNQMYKVSPAYRLGNETDIMYEIVNSGPVQATMRVFQDFFHYESGIYTHSKLSEHYSSGYHSVRIVGWGEEPSPFNGTPIKFWRVANSWGREWGEDGYFRISKGRNECEIEDFVLGVWSKTI